MWLGIRLPFRFVDEVDAKSSQRAPTAPPPPMPLPARQPKPCFKMTLPWNSQKVELKCFPQGGVFVKTMTGMSRLEVLKVLRIFMFHGFLSTCCLHYLTHSISLTDLIPLPSPAESASVVYTPLPLPHDLDLTWKAHPSLGLLLADACSHFTKGNYLECLNFLWMGCEHLLRRTFVQQSRMAQYHQEKDKTRQDEAKQNRDDAVAAAVTAKSEGNEKFDTRFSTAFREAQSMIPPFMDLTVTVLVQNLHEHQSLDEELSRQIRQMIRIHHDAIHTLEASQEHAMAMGQLLISLLSEFSDVAVPLVLQKFFLQEEVVDHPLAVVAAGASVSFSAATAE